LRQPHFRSRLADFLLNRDDGFITSLSLFLLIAMFMFGGLALDVMNATTQRTHLQITADSVAHAAIHARADHSEEEARTIALQIGEGNMPAARFGEVVRADDIEFGTWDADAREFIPGPGERQAVRVTTRQESSRGNPVATFLLHLVGVDVWDLRATAVFLAQGNPCFFDGFVAEGPVSFNSNNHFASEFCIHSNDHVWLRQNNVFDPGAIVSMPDLADLDVPGGNTSGNPGLDEALVAAWMDLSILNQIPEIIQELAVFGSDRTPDYIVAAGVVTLDRNGLSGSDFVEGRIHRVTCSGNGNNARLTIPNNTVLRNIVLVTNCAITFGNGAAVEDSIIATTSTDGASIRGSAGARFGRDTNCEPGPGTQIITAGGMFFPAKLTVHGAQMLAAGVINFQANAGVEGRGASFLAGEIDGRTNMETGRCGVEMQNHVRGNPRLRLAL